mmetsp:Transcript_29734/g.41062  ORF Transcript_29734/g.41062 Transcript_29734/m.41062 type:complete len:219 (+) Transcript_29734:77-733(+)
MSYPQHPTNGYPVSAAPAQYQGVSYVSTPPAYIDSTPTPPSQASVVANKVGAGIGKALSGFGKKTGNLINHVSAAGGVEKGIETMGGKANYVASMICSGGTSRYWKKMFTNIQKSEKLIESFSCYLFGQNGPCPGVLFIGSASIAFCSDSSIPTPQGSVYLKAYLPFERIGSYQPSTNADGQWIGAIMLDGFQFWFSGFSDYNSAMKFLTESAQAFRI